MSAGSRIALGASRVALQPALTLRIVPSGPTDLRWASSSSRSSLGLGAAISAAFAKPPSPSAQSKKRSTARPQATIEARSDGLPGFIPLEDPTPFTHRSLSNTTRWPSERPQTVDGVPYTHYDYEKHAAFGGRILQMLLMEFINDSCPHLSATGATSLLKCLTSSTTTSSLARTYRLPWDRLQADSATLPAVQRLASVQSDLLLAYIAGLFNEQGYATTRIWVREAFEVALGQQYVELKQKSEEPPAPSATSTAPTASSEAEDVAVQRIRRWARSERVELRVDFEMTGEPRLQVHTCRLRLEQREFVGTGHSRRKAKTSAAIKALKYVGEPNSAAPEQNNLHPSMPSSSERHYTRTFKAYCCANQLESTFLLRDQHDGAGSFLCRLSWGSPEGMQRRVEATGRGKSRAKHNAAEAALKSMGML